MAEFPNIPPIGDGPRSKDPGFLDINPVSNFASRSVDFDAPNDTVLKANVAKSFILSNFNLARLKPRNFVVPTQSSDNEIVSGQTPPEQSFGLPFFTNLEFQGGSFQTLDGEIIQYLPLRLDTVLMSVSMNKTIIKTAVQGKSGTVKEYASDGDFEIDVRGVLVGNGHNVYPDTEVELLNSLLTVPEKLKITSEFLDHFGVISPSGMPGISEVVIESFSFPQSEGFRNVQLFQFKMLSDTPIELTI